MKLEMNKLSRVCLGVCILISLNSSVVLADDWPMFMGNPQRTGQVDVPTPAKISAMKLSWQYAFNASVSATPIATGNQLLVAAENGNLYAFDWTLKKLQWIYHTEGGIASTPVAVDGVVYFLSRDGYFYAVTLADAQLVWRYKTQGERKFSALGGYDLPLSKGATVDAWDFYLSSPLIHQGTVYFGSSDEHVYALDIKTGMPKWVFKGDESFHASPSYSDDKIYIGSMGTRLYALNAETGEKAWDFQGGAERRYSVMLGFIAAATVDDNQVYIGGRDANFYAFNKTDGKLQWQYDAKGSWVMATAAVDDENVYVATSDTGLLLAINKKTGKEKYRFNTRVWTYTSPVVVANKYIFVGTMTGELYGVDKQSGKQLWYYQTPERKADLMGIVDKKSGKLIDDKLFTKGRQLQAGVEYVKELGAFLASPIWIDNQLIAITANGKMLVFK